MDKLAILIIVSLVIVIAVLVVRQNKDKLSGFFGKKERTEKPKKNAPSERKEPVVQIPAKLENAVKMPQLKDLKNIFDGIKEHNEKKTDTLIIGRGTIQQLDSNTGDVISEFTVSYSENPLCISKPSSSKKSYLDQLIIVKNSPATDLISSNAYYLFTDTESGDLSLEYREGIKEFPGCLKDTENNNKVINPIFLYNHKTNEIIKFTDVDAYIPLADGQLFSLGGRQWFRYLKPKETGDIDPKVFIGGAKKSFIDSSFKSDASPIMPPEEDVRLYNGKKAYSPLSGKESENTRQNTHTFTFNKEDGVNR